MKGKEYTVTQYANIKKFHGGKRVTRQAVLKKIKTLKAKKTGNQWIITA